MNKEQYKELLIDMLKDMPELLSGYDEEIIYQIDDLNVYGGFEMGSRGVDHNILLFENEGIGWDEILQFGTVIVPETQTYINDEPVDQFDALNYDRLPLTANHIVGGMQ